MRSHSFTKRYGVGLMVLTLSLLLSGNNWAQPNSLESTSNQPVSEILAELEILNKKIDSLQEVVDNLSKEMESQGDIRNVDKPVHSKDQNIPIEQKVCDLNHGKCPGVESEIYVNDGRQE